ncbi:MAG: HEPN domain-containing protein [Marinilabiliales bacterium]|nr:MAG: HEPN domain-containing protein [Marinilabiliales bacterium]
MTIESRDDYIRYRYQRGLESYDDALILLEKKRWNTIINRLYYACFYAVIALLLKKNIETHTHDGARNQFNLQFIKKGLIDKNQGKLFSKLFDYRQKGDYGDLFDFDEQLVLPLFDQVKVFLKEIKKHLEF